MATVELWVGTQGPILLDDTSDYALKGGQVVRRDDLEDLAIDKTSVVGILKGVGGDVVQAVEGTDYIAGDDIRLDDRRMARTGTSEVGIAKSVTLAKLTTNGSAGSLVFVDGILISAIAPT